MVQQPDWPAFLVEADSGERHALPEGDYALIGRDAECDITLDTASIASRHAALWRHEGALWLEDLGSGGTWVNGEPATAPRRLEHGDRIRVGAKSFSFRHHGTAAVETAYLEPRTTTRRMLRGNRREALAVGYGGSYLTPPDVPGARLNGRT